jgi:hypothetical protein
VSKEDFEREFLCVPMEERTAICKRCKTEFVPVREEDGFIRVNKCDHCHAESMRRDKGRWNPIRR